MIYSATLKNGFWSYSPLRQILAGLFLALFFTVATLYGQTNLSYPDENTLVVEEAKEMEIYSFGKNVIVKKEAKGVLAFGGDIIVEGRVEGDVATIGGTIYQKEGAFIGGDVITFGGAYKPESHQPLRSAGKETVVFAGYETELRELMQNPSQIFAPQMTWTFFAQRLLSLLFWFVLSLGLTTIAPGAVSRAVARFQLSTLKISALGLVAVIFCTVGVVTCLKYLPNYLGAIVSLMIFLTLILAYVFGRITLQVSAGKLLQRILMPDGKHSETIALFIGSALFTVLLSLPYLWAITVFIVWISSLGLVLTARPAQNWPKL